MRLINASTLKIEQFLNEATTPAFAILSHTWGADEVTLEQMEDPDVSRRKGYLKIQLCCKQALEDGLQWAWVDTCCIDKTSTAELSEAINSMFRWYRNAEVCYAYISDARGREDLASSRWFSRGWTLQELVAPAVVRFYDSDWQYIGSKLELCDILWGITNIEESVLRTGKIGTISIARRMSWAAKRQTTRVEDHAYSLMGIFDVNMPLLYGEGKRSFLRLQEEILKSSDDHSLFAWGIPQKIRTYGEYIGHYHGMPLPQLYGLFAASPADFTYSQHIVPLEDHASKFPTVISSSGVRIELQFFSKDSFHQFAVIFCTHASKLDHYLGFQIVPWGNRYYARRSELIAIPVTTLVGPKSLLPYRQPSALLIREPIMLATSKPVNNTIRMLEINANQKFNPRVMYTAYNIDYSSTSFSPQQQNVNLTANLEGLHAVFYFAPEHDRNDLLLECLEHHSPPKSNKNALDNQEISRHLSSGELGRNAKKGISFIQPEFAVLVGGRWDKPWLRVVFVLNDENPDADLKSMANIRSDIAKICTTKQHLQTLLKDQTSTDPLLETKGNRTNASLLYAKDKREPRFPGVVKVSIDLQVKHVAHNLAEHGLVLYYGYRHHTKNATTWNREAGFGDSIPPWWAFRS